MAVMRPRSAADFYPTVNAALRHERADSEEDREGLRCHLGQGLSDVKRYRIVGPSRRFTGVARSRSGKLFKFKRQRWRQPIRSPYANT